MRAPGPALDYQNNDGRYLCHLCPQATGTKNWRRHCGSVTHKRNVQRRDEARRSSKPVVNESVGPEGGPGPAAPTNDRTQAENHAHTERVWERIEHSLALDDVGARSDMNTSALENYLDEMESIAARQKAADLGNGAGEGTRYKRPGETSFRCPSGEREEKKLQPPSPLPHTHAHGPQS
ncbi:hypothetical protein PGT21_003347 [Puccinia graminis f. sp. tritici]|uniref:U1-type domain-containing protein n=1 Tax=Puccinia graminis f. sp. tritici TaxID=56615 RepID=A0A5B0N2Y5_PUCGR|nr:hypothetical protein PGT21_003347 [Puccinia graminis f. sp. tritici]KAA1133668.1 hypothetical protein PGTUg99_030472 [Puccinia graminis f. sp. tritici]